MKNSSVLFAISSRLILASHFIVHTHLLNHDPSSFSWEMGGMVMLKSIDIFEIFEMCVESVLWFVGFIIILRHSHLWLLSKFCTIFQLFPSLHLQFKITSTIQLTFCHSHCVNTHHHVKIGWRLTWNQEFVRIFLNLITRLMDRGFDLILFPLHEFWLL